MLRYIWISVNAILGAYMLCVFAYFFLAGSFIVGKTLKGFAIWVFEIVISLPQILYAIVILFIGIIKFAVAFPLDSILTILGGIVLLAIIMGYTGLLEDTEQKVRRGSSLQSASSVRRRLGGQGRSPLNKGERTGPPVQLRRGSRLTSADSIRNRGTTPSSWLQKLWSLFNPGSDLKVLPPENQRPTTETPTSPPAASRGRGRRLN